MGQAGLPTQPWRQWGALQRPATGLPLWPFGVPGGLGQEFRFQAWSHTGLGLSLSSATSWLWVFNKLLHASEP